MQCSRSVSWLIEMPKVRGGKMTGRKIKEANVGKNENVNRSVKVVWIEWFTCSLLSTSIEFTQVMMVLASFQWLWCVGDSRPAPEESNPPMSHKCWSPLHGKWASAVHEVHGSGGCDVRCYGEAKSLSIIQFVLCVSQDTQGGTNEGEKCIYPVHYSMWSHYIHIYMAVCPLDNCVPAVCAANYHNPQLCREVWSVEHKDETRWIILVWLKL